MKNTILIISKNLPYAKSLARAFAGNPLAPILSKHVENPDEIGGDKFSILCPQADDEIAQVVDESTIRLVIVDASAGADMFNRFVRLQRDGIIPRGIGLLVLGGLSCNEAMQDAFTLGFPVNLDDLAKLIDAALERPPSEWIKQENTAINRQRYTQLNAQVRSLKHRFDGQVSSRSIRLANLEQWQSLLDRSKELQRIIMGRNPQEMWMLPFLREFDEIRTQNPEFSQNAGLQMQCDDVQNSLQLLQEFAKDILSGTLTEEQLSIKSNEFKNAMNAVADKFKDLADFLEKANF